MRAAVFDRALQSSSLLRLGPREDRCECLVRRRLGRGDSDRLGRRGPGAPAADGCVGIDARRRFDGRDVVEDRRSGVRDDALACGSRVDLGDGPAWLEDWLAQQGKSLDEVRSWAVHPGGPRILAAFGETMDLPRTAPALSYETLSSYGNMSSATILFTLKSLLTGRPRRRSWRSPSAGLTVEAALLE